MDDLVHKGHRQRMRRKFLEFGPRFFDTYELLEMLLYITVPVKDTNPIAKRLLLKFGSLDGVFNAEVSELTEVEGVGLKTANMIKTTANLYDMCFLNTDIDDEVEGFENYDLLGGFIARYMKDYKSPVQLLLSFNNNMELMGIDEVYNFDYSSGATHPNGFLNAAVKRNASVVVIAHNHLYGPLCPTEGDRQTNSVIEFAFHNTGVVFLEHYIVTGDGYVGFMNCLKHHFAQRPSLEKFFISKRLSQNE